MRLLGLDGILPNREISSQKAGLEWEFGKQGKMKWQKD